LISLYLLGQSPVIEQPPQPSAALESVEEQASAHTPRTLS
jgi:hypothetical protein